MDVAPSEDLVALMAGDARPAVARSLGEVRHLRALARFHLRDTYSTCPAEVYLLIGRDPKAYDDVAEAVCEAILDSLGYYCSVTDCPALLGDHPLVEWHRVSSSMED